MPKRSLMAASFPAWPDTPEYPCRAAAGDYVAIAVDGSIIAIARVVAPAVWQLSDVVKIEPIPCGDHQGMWRVPDELLPTIRQRWAVARSPEGLIAWWRANEGSIRRQLPIQVGEITHLRRWPDVLNNWITLWERGQITPRLAQSYVFEPLKKLRESL